MVTVTIEGKDVTEVRTQMAALIGSEQHFTIQPTLVVDLPKELKREKKSKETAAPAEEKAPEQATEKAPEGAVPYSAVQEIVPKVLKVVKREVLLPMFAKFGGAKSAKDLKPEHYAEFIADAQKVIDSAPKA